MTSVSENVFFVESALFLSQNKNGTYLNQGICIYAGHSFYEIQFNYFFISHLVLLVLIVV